ncbi:MAG: hypothetical protein MJ121_02335 [Clostridia bacterium]|nr:hypothetical protein [Clostridia bacterium]
MKKKLSLTKLLSKDYVVFIISAILAVFLWAYVNVNMTPQVTATIENVPVSIDSASLSEIYGISVMDKKDFFVDVTVTGERYIVDREDIKNQINVVADISDVSGSGKTELSLRATTENDNVVIVGLSKQAISVYLDYQDSKSFSVTPNARNENFNLPQGYSYGDFKVTTASKITVKGPATEIEKITGVEAVFDIDEKEIETKTYNAALKVVSDRYVDTTYVSFFNGKTEINEVKVSVPVLKLARLKTQVDFVGAPSPAYEYSAKISVSELQVAMPEKMLESTSTIVIGTINYNTLRPGTNEYEVNTKDIKVGGVTIMDEATIKITVKAENVESKDYTAPFTVTLPESEAQLNAGIEADFTKVTVVGSASELKTLTEDGLNLQVDLSGIDTTQKGVYTVPVVLESENAWLYGSDYVATVTIR